jgi:hypothetical protein
MHLLGEEINTQVSVLASGGRCCDSDDLARTTLKNQEITQADVVGWDGDGVGFDGAARCWLTTTTSYGNVNFFPLITRTSTDETLGSTFNSMCERVVVTWLGVRIDSHN